MYSNFNSFQTKLSFSDLCCEQLHSPTPNVPSRRAEQARKDLNCRRRVILIGVTDEVEESQTLEWEGESSEDIPTLP